MLNLFQSSSVKNSIGRFILLVHDYEETLRFYQDVLGFQILFDSTSETGKRYLHMGPAKKEGTGIWFLKADTPDQQQAVGRQTLGQPTFVLYTNAFEKMHEKLQEHGVRIRKKPQETEDARFLHFLDLYGNEIVMVELLN